MTSAAYLRLRICNPGIAVRLGISFAAVAMLAVSANLIVEHGASVIESIRSRAAATPVNAPAALHPSIIPPSLTKPDLVDQLPTAELLDAFSQFERAVMLRVQVDTPEKQTLLESADSHLSDELVLFSGPARDVLLTSKDTAALAHQVRKARAAVDNVIKTGDSRRASLLAYSSHFENLDAAFKRALDHNWKIFGRVIARESLITLSHQLWNKRATSCDEPPGDRVIKVNHPGENGALNIYRAQLLAACWRKSDLKSGLRQFLEHEKRHRAGFAAELTRRGRRRCRSYWICTTDPCRAQGLHGLHVALPMYSTAPRVARLSRQSQRRKYSHV